MRRRHNNRKQKNIALVGNPNVGKSCLFNQLTGLGVNVANYPGTTVEIYSGKTRMHGEQLNIIDLPGTYAIGDQSIEDKIVRDYLLDERPDVVIDVVDANLLERNLYLLLQLIELKIPTVLALNFYEESQDKGVEIDFSKLEKELGIPIVPIDALRGAGVGRLLQKAVHQSKTKSLEFKYDDHIEDAIEKISDLTTSSLPSRAFAISLLSDEKKAWHELNKNNSDSADKVRKIIKKVSKYHDLPTAIAKERHGQAAIIAKKVTSKKKTEYTSNERLDRLTTEPLSGTLILMGILAILFASLFVLGGFLEVVIIDSFDSFIAPTLHSIIDPISNEAIRGTLEYALIFGVEAGLSIAIPYILVFYIFLAFLEDTGYLPRMGFLLDRFMHKLGLHGKAIVPMMLGFGCTVPAIVSTRLLQNKRERLITAILLSFIPCSARTAIILGAVGFYVGWTYALSIYAILLAIVFVAGIVLSRWLPGEPEGLIMEMPKYRMPSIISIIKKAWIRVKGFVYIAFPILVVGSGILGLLGSLNLLEVITQPFDPIISGWLMLPAVTGIALIYGILRKEMALATLLVLAGAANLLEFMTPLQIYVFALVSAIYVPCIATIGVLIREFGLRRSLLIAFTTIVLAFLVGGIVARVFPMLGLLG